MGSNGIVTETAHHNIDRKKFGESYDNIFGGPRKPKTALDRLLDIIASKYQMTNFKAEKVLTTISEELNKEIDHGELAESILKLGEK